MLGSENSSAPMLSSGQFEGLQSVQLRLTGECGAQSKDLKICNMQAG